MEVGGAQTYFLWNPELAQSFENRRTGLTDRSTEGRISEALATDFSYPS